MTTVLQVGDRAITFEEAIHLLVSYQLLPQLLREVITDQAIAPITYSLEEQASACHQFKENHRLTAQTQRQAWLKRYGMTLEQLEALAIRKLRIEKFKQATWGYNLESYFLKRKPQLDKVIYSQLLTKDREIAQELYFRVQEGEQPFAELAQANSQCPEAQVGGLIGPAELCSAHPALAQMLSASQPGQLWPPSS